MCGLRSSLPRSGLVGIPSGLTGVVLGDPERSAGDWDLVSWVLPLTSADDGGWR